MSTVWPSVAMTRLTMGSSRKVSFRSTTISPYSYWSSSREVSTSSRSPSCRVGTMEWPSTPMSRMTKVNSSTTASTEATSAWAHS